MLDRVAASLADIGKIEADAKLEGRNMTMVIAPQVKDGSDMPKQKTKRAAMKRFKRTGTGKLKRWHANHTPHPDQEDAQAEEPAQEGATW